MHATDYELLASYQVADQPCNVVSRDPSQNREQASEVIDDKSGRREAMLSEKVLCGDCLDLGCLVSADYTACSELDPFHSRELRRATVVTGS